MSDAIPMEPRVPPNPLCASPSAQDVIAAVRQVQRFIHVGETAARGDMEGDHQFEKGKDWLWSLCEDALGYAEELIENEGRQASIRSI